MENSPSIFQDQGVNVFYQGLGEGMNSQHFFPPLSQPLQELSQAQSVMHADLMHQQLQQDQVHMQQQPDLLQLQTIQLPLPPQPLQSRLHQNSQSIQPHQLLQHQQHQLNEEEETTIPPVAVQQTENIQNQIETLKKLYASTQASLSNVLSASLSNQQNMFDFFSFNSFIFLSIEDYHQSLPPPYIFPHFLITFSI